MTGRTQGKDSLMEGELEPSVRDLHPALPSPRPVQHNPPLLGISQLCPCQQEELATLFHLGKL